MKKSLLGCLLLIGVGGLLISACSAPAELQPLTPVPGPSTPAPTLTSPAPKEVWPKAVFMSAGSSTTSSGYIMDAAISQLINKYIPGVSASAGTSPSMEATMATLVSGENDFTGVTFTELGLTFFLPEHPLRGKVGGFRELFESYRGNWEIIATPAVTKIKDLEGKRFAYKSASVNTMLIWKVLFDYYGVDATKVLGSERVGQTKHAEMMKEGALDAACDMGASPTAAYTELFKTKPGMHVISLDEGALKAVQTKANPAYLLWAMPPGTYPGQDNPVNTLQFGESFLTRKEMPEGLVYQVTKVFHEHIDEVRAAHPQFKIFSLKHSIFTLHAPIHPGAKRYYQEVGAWTPELEAQNKELLAKFGAQ